MKNKHGPFVPANLITSNHWGVTIAKVKDGKIQTLEPHPIDPDPSLINNNVAASLHGKARVLRPAVRKGWLNRTSTAPDGKRGEDEFVEVSWDEALTLIAGEVDRIRTAHGNEAIYAGSYGWSSAGRFHHAQSQLKRFLNCCGGFVPSWGNYSYNAALIMMPYIVGPYRNHVRQATRWPMIAKHGSLVVMFGGLAMRNSQISDGGITKHRLKDHLEECRNNGVRFINISPHRGDAEAMLDAEWLAPYPGSDTAMMMGIAHTLLAENLHDQSFLDQYTTGFDRLKSYLMGDEDGVVKDADWAEAQSSIPADRLRALAREMASQRTMISIAAGLQRADYGEQPLWMGMSLAAMLGQIGLAGGGYVVGYGVNGNIGNIDRLFRWGPFPQHENPVSKILPVAMITEMLLNPKGEYQYEGKTHQFPDARMVWWAGGNPFHHHQDLNELRRGFQTPETVIVNEINWTSTARHADIVLPVSAPQERRDIGGGQSDNGLVPMQALVPPPGDARNEYAIYTDLAEKLGVKDKFTEGRSEEDWLKKMWQDTIELAQQHDIDLPDWDGFMAGDVIEIPDPAPECVFLSAFRDDPAANPLPTPSGKLEIYSELLASFNLKDCLGHPAYFPPRDMAAGDVGELYLISGQPKTRLHSQHDNGEYSLSHKINGREPVLINPIDAAKRGIKNGDIITLKNKRGSCLAGAVLTEDIRQGVLFLWTGAWYDPDFNEKSHRDRHGNPNVLTHDRRTSSLTQSPASHSTMVNAEKFEEDLPPITVHDQPNFSRRS